MNPANAARFGQRSMGGVVQDILLRTAKLMSEGLTEFAELAPTDEVPSNGIAVPAGMTSNGISIQFPCDGLVVGIRATTRDGTPVSQNSTLLRVQKDGDTELFPSASGGGPGFMAFGQISGNAQFLARLVTRQRFQQATFWNIFVQNGQPQIATTVAVASNGQASPGVGNILNVASTFGFPTSGFLQVAGIVGLISYTGTTATSFTGTLGGVGVFATGASVVSTVGNIVADVTFDIIRTTNLRTG